MWPRCQLYYMPVNESVLALENEDLSGEGHRREVRDEYDDAGRHEVSEVGGLVQDWIQCVFHNGFPHALCSMGHILLRVNHHLADLGWMFHIS